MRKIILGESLVALAELPDEFAQLVYVDPPFNTGRSQTRWRRASATISQKLVGFERAASVS